MVGWHHRLNGHECEQALGVGDGLGSLEYYSPWMAESRTRLSSWTELSWAEWCVLSCSVVYNCVTTWTGHCQAPLSLEFPRQEYCSGLPLPTSGDLPDPGVEPTYPASPALLGGFFTTEQPGKLPPVYELPKIRCNWVSPFFVL